MAPILRNGGSQSPDRWLREPRNNHKYIETELNNSFDTYFRNIDFSKFKENVEPKYIYHMLVMLSEGYLSEKQRTNSPIIFDEAVKELKKWQNILKQASYKEEYL